MTESSSMARIVTEKSTWHPFHDGADQDR
jgi:hypothetical protein